MKSQTAGCVGGNSRQADHSLGANPSNAGLVLGARILTVNGEQLVENLRVGDRLISRSCGCVPITEIEVVSLVTPVIYILAGSIGHSRRDRDTMLTSDQTVMLRDWRAQGLFGQQAALTPARRLVDGEFVRGLGQHAVTIHRIHCATPQTFFADGLELGTADTMPSDHSQSAA